MKAIRKCEQNNLKLIQYKSNIIGIVTTYFAI